MIAFKVRKCNSANSFMSNVDIGRVKVGRDILLGLVINGVTADCTLPKILFRAHIRNVTPFTAGVSWIVCNLQREAAILLSS